MLAPHFFIFGIRLVTAANQLGALSGFDSLNADCQLWIK
nr:MAG TPA: hypothetical protein [Caudoviricetes sp.]